ncbi:MAG: hypothetical protein CME15_06760 [Gemmatimonadetes bacterium]|nr:hypothetical protein [Gemmatimonadota bacterium]
MGQLVGTSNPHPHQIYAGSPQIYTGDRRSGDGRGRGLDRHQRGDRSARYGGRQGGSLHRANGELESEVRELLGNQLGGEVVD